MTARQPELGPHKGMSSSSDRREAAPRSVPSPAPEEDGGSLASHQLSHVDCSPQTPPGHLCVHDAFVGRSCSSELAFSPAAAPRPSEEAPCPAEAKLRGVPFCTFAGHFAEDPSLRPVTEQGALKTAVLKAEPVGFRGGCGVPPAG